VVVLAQEEARALKHNYIGTEHILLGLLREEEGLAARALESLDVTVELVRAQIVRIVGSGDEVTSGQIPFTPRAKNVLELALREALSLGHNHIGTEHILLGLARENEGVAARILLDADADAERIRNEVIRMLAGPVMGWRAHAGDCGQSSRAALAPSWLGGLGATLDGLDPAIRDRLDRSPDSGDLLLVLASAPATRAAEALRTLGVHLDALTAAVERARADIPISQDGLRARLELVRRHKRDAAGSEAYERAAELRDEERELSAALAGAAVSPEVLAEVMQRLGLAPA